MSTDLYAGRTRTITRQTLSQDDAIMEEQADRTTAIYPAGDVRRDTDVAVHVNPAVLPQMTAIETAVSEALLEKNPDVDPDEDGVQTAAFATIARSCVKRAGAPGSAITTSDCESLPMLVTGYDAAGPARNDRLALVDHPEWVLNHRRDIGDNPKWYNQTVTCGDAARDAARVALAPATPGCHEFPFWTSLEGYGGPRSFATTPRLELVPQPQNAKQGSVLKAMQNRCGVVKASNSVSPATPLMTLRASAFLNVPIGEHAGRIKTVGLC